MFTARSNDPRADTVSLEAVAASARAGFGCMFSTSDEYESALITERRAQGRYARGAWSKLMLAACMAAVAGAVVLLV